MTSHSGDGVVEVVHHGGPKRIQGLPRAIDYHDKLYQKDGQTRNTETRYLLSTYLSKFRENVSELRPLRGDPSLEVDVARRTQLHYQRGQLAHFLVGRPAVHPFLGKEEHP